jgi:hypothetical protein
MESAILFTVMTHERLIQPTNEIWKRKEGNVKDQTKQMKKKSSQGQSTNDVTF